MSSQGLEGLRVLELGGGVSASVAGKQLADLGATVIKVEPPGGDPVRRRGPFRHGQPDPEASGTFLYLNTNKRSLVLDLQNASDRASLERLVTRADLLIHDCTPREMAALGMDWERYAALNRRLVMLSITPFGLTGPYRDFAGTDLTLTHAGGWGYIAPGHISHPEQPPLKPFGQHALVQAGLHGAITALAACYRAARTGLGEHIDLSVQEVVILLTGRHFAYADYAHDAMSYHSPAPYEPYSFYRTRGGYMYIVCPEQDQWNRLVTLMGRPAWVDKRFSTREARRKNKDELKVELDAWTSGQSAEVLFHALQQEKVGVAPVFSHAELERDAHLRSRRFFVKHQHPRAGSVPLPGAPYKLNHPWWILRHPAPALGEANGEQERLFAGEATRRPVEKPVAAGGHPESTSMLPLEGVRVLDLSWVWAGPHATQMLAFLGAEVIKVESSGRPDLTRRWQIHASGLEPGLNRCGYFNAVNQNKKSVGIDLSRPEGIALVKELAGHCDVMISNFGTGVMEKLGLAPTTMLALNPRLIVAMISAAGQTGPYRNYTGYGPLIAPLAGVAANTRYPGEDEPQDVGIAYGDPNGGVYAGLAIAAALWHRAVHDDGGLVIDVSMWEAMISTGFEGWMNHALGNPPYPAMGNQDPLHAPHNVYRCAGEDRWVAVAVTDNTQWRGLCRALGREDLSEDPRYREASERKVHEKDLDAWIGAWCADQSPWEVTRRLQAQGVPAFPSLDVLELVRDPHLNVRDTLTHHPHPEVGVRTLMGAPWRLTRGANGIGKASPLLGEDTDAVLETLLGLDASQRARLRAEGVVE